MTFFPLSKTDKGPLSSFSILAFSISVLSGNNTVYAATDETKATLEEIYIYGEYVVNDQLDTATGLGLTLQETPQSVSIITSQQLEDQGLQSLTDVIVSAAGISSKAYDSSRNGFSSRGFDVDNYQIDGIPVNWEGGSSAGESQTDMALYERVEIVRGATGLLTGAGHPSASINLVRKHADSEELTGYASLSFSRWNTYNGTLDVSNRLNDSGSVRGRAVFVYEDGDSYVDYAGNEKSVLYAVLDADLTEDTVLSVGASHQDNNPRASQWGGLPIFFDDGSRTNWARSKTVGADWTYWATTHDTVFINLNHSLNDNWQLRFNLNRTESESEMRLLYLSGSPDPDTGLGMAASPSRFDNERTQDDIGLRLTGTYTLFNREHELVAGAQQSQQDFVYSSYTSSGSPEVGNFFEWDGNIAEPDWSNPAAFQEETTEQTGFYVATRLSISDPLKVVIGSRLADWERKNHISGELYGDDGIVIPYAGVLYDFTDHHTFYTSYTEIFEAQNALDAQGNYLEPLVGTNRELGIKSRYFDDALHTTVTLFWAEEDNVAVEDENFEPTETQLSAYRAAEGVKSDGFELEIVGQISDHWQISANYTEFEATEQNSDGDAANTVNTRFPRKLFSLFSTYDWQAFTLGGGINWEGENYTNVTNPATSQQEKATQDPFALVNLMARYRMNDQFSTQVNIDNVFDKTYYSQIGFYTQLAYGEPRNIKVSLKYQF